MLSRKQYHDPAADRPCEGSCWPTGDRLAGSARKRARCGPRQRRPRAPGGLFPGFDGHDGVSGNGLWSALRIRNVPANHPGWLAAGATGQLAASPGPLGGRPATRESGSQLNCSFQLKEGRLRINIGTPSVLIGIPYDRPVVGYNGRTINTLRLWAAAVPDSFDFEVFSHGEFVGAVAESLAAESLTRVLYPDDSTIRGHGLRFVQEYFLVACSLADLARRFRAANEDWTKFPDKVAIQLKDTHPAIAVPELMRILLDEVPLPWDEAWNITRRALAYTNHTLLPELSRSGQWIGSKNCCFVSSRSFMPTHRPGPVKIPRRGRSRTACQPGRRRPTRHVRMANLAIVGSHSTSGVAAIHSRLLRMTTVKDLAEMFPERFSNKTNGVTPRRWLLLANPALANLVTTAIGEAWITNLAELGRLKPLVNDTGFLDAFQKASLQAKGVFADVLRAKYGETVDPDTIFDSQVKRIHEYKKATSQCVANRRPLQSASRKPESRDGAANLSFRWQGGARLQTCQTDHQIDQQSSRHNRWRSGNAWPNESLVSTRLQRVPGRAVDPSQRHFQPGLDRRLRSQRHQQHEVHDDGG